MMKKSMAIAAATVFLGSALAANAQLYPYTGTSTAPSSTVIAATSTASSTATTSSTISSTVSATIEPSNSNVAAVTTTTGSSTTTTTVVPVITSTAGAIGEYIQIDGLVVASIPATGTAEPVQIMAANPAYDTVTASGAVMSASTAAVDCTQFATDSSPTGIAVTCPTPPATTMMANTTSSSSPNGNYYSPYMINVNAATQLEMSDRTSATLADITPGDTINVYGYYDGNGIIDVEILRDMSKPVGGAMTSTGTTSTAALQAELNQLEALVAQLESELTMSTSTTVDVGASSSLGTSLYCPMIPAGASSSVTCPPPGAPTTTASGTPIIYY
jgi:trimeric autotransporter adhesin